MDKKPTRGGARENAGRTALPDDEKKVTVSFQIKKKHVAAAKAKLQPIINRMNKK